MMMRWNRGQEVEARASAAGVGRRRKISSRISSTRCGAGVGIAGGRRRDGRKGMGGFLGEAAQSVVRLFWLLVRPCVSKAAHGMELEVANSA